MTSLSKLSQIKVTVTGARGAVGLDLVGTPTPGQFVVFNADRKVQGSAGTGADAGLRTDLAGPGGSALVEYGGGSVATALDRISASRSVSVLDFIPQEKWESIRAGTNTDDLTSYFRQAAVACRRTSASMEALAVGTVYVPGGRYHITEVGIQGVVFRGETREGTVLRAFSAGASSKFMLDGMLTPDTLTKTTVGTGWAENLSIDGRLPKVGADEDQARSGRSGLRTYGGGNNPHRLDIRNCGIGLACGLPIWQVVSNVFAQSCNVAFYTFHDAPGDNGTSTIFQSCWAYDSLTYGFHISQLYYSSFINCVSQNAGTHNFYLQGDLNGTTACYSLQFIGCATEGGGTPFYLKRGRDITIINPRIIQPAANVHFINLDDTAGSIMDFSTPGSPGAGKVHVWTNNATPYSIALINSAVTYETGSEGVFLRLGAGAPGTTMSGLSGSSLYVDGKKVVDQQGVAISLIDTTGLTGAALTNADTTNAIIDRLRNHGLIAS